jgi:hypothetical protein
MLFIIAMEKIIHHVTFLNPFSFHRSSKRKVIALVDDYFVFAHHIVDKVFLLTKTYDSAFVKGK